MNISFNFSNAVLCIAAFVALLIMASPTIVVAQSNGETRFSGNRWQYYHSGAWRNIHLGSSQGSCSGNSGATRYASGLIQWCDGSNWRSGFNGVVGTSCSNTGEVDYRNGRMEYCDSVFWLHMDARGNNYTCNGSTGNWGGAGSSCSPIVDCDGPFNFPGGTTACCEGSPPNSTCSISSGYEYTCFGGSWGPQGSSCTVAVEDCDTGLYPSGDTACCGGTPPAPSDSTCSSGGPSIQKYQCMGGSWNLHFPNDCIMIDGNCNVGFNTDGATKCCASTPTATCAAM